MDFGFGAISRIGDLVRAGGDDQSNRDQAMSFADVKAWFEVLDTESEGR